MLLRWLEGGLVCTGWVGPARRRGLARGIEEVSCLIVDDDLSEASFDLEMGELSSPVENVMATGGLEARLPVLIWVRQLVRTWGRV